MSAGTADNAGMPQSKQFHMVNTNMFHHPKYYKNLRKLARNSELHVRPIDGGEASDTDQAISSLDTREVVGSVRPGPGLKRQASSNKLREIQASSGKHQAPSTKVQAPSRKRQAPGPWILEKVSR
jgi:hypothetical protein